ncbi:transporter [Allostella vacuolata]|nr:transporter [Stella vacuolata]
MLERLFGLSAHGTTVRTEVVAGVTTFLAMAYILFVNPAILKDAGMDPGAVFVATGLAAAFGSAFMGLYANYPIALAPGMGINAYFAYGVVQGMGHSWQVALGAVFVSGVLFLLLSLVRVREWIINSIPRALKMAISTGIGLLLAIIALQNAGIVAAHPATMVTVGRVTAPPAIIAALAFFAIVALDRRQVPGALILGIVGATAAGIALGLVPFRGIVDAPPSLMPTLLQMDIGGALELGVATVVFAFLFVSLFDTAGTLIGVAWHGRLLDADGRLPRLGRALVADSSAIMAGAALGTSTTTAYIESAAGMKAGGRTGLTACVTALLFLASLVFAPLVLSVPGFATAPALFFVACMMVRGITEVDWEDASEYAPAVVTAVAMPFTFSIAHGIAFGFIAYAAIKLLSGRGTEVSATVWVLAGLFLVKFAVT